MHKTALGSALRRDGEPMTDDIKARARTFAFEQTKNGRPLDAAELAEFASAEADRAVGGTAPDACWTIESQIITLLDTKP